MTAASWDELAACRQLLLLQAGGFLCNPHYDWKVNSSAAGQSILGRLSVGEAASGRGERNECEASHPVTAPSPIFSQPLPPTSASRGAPPGSCGSCWGMAGPGGWAPHASPARSNILSSPHLGCGTSALGSSQCDVDRLPVISSAQNLSQGIHIWLNLIISPRLLCQEHLLKVFTINSFFSNCIWH